MFTSDTVKLNDADDVIMLCCVLDALLKTASSKRKLTDADDVIVLCCCVLDALLKKASTKRKLTDADDLFTPGTGPAGKRSRARQTAAAAKKDRKTQLPIAIPDAATRQLVDKWHSK